MKKNMEKNPLHLGLGATAVSEPAFTGMKWYDDYIKRHRSDGVEGRLVSLYTFDDSWDSWEMHPNGDEVVLCLQGKITLVQEINGKKKRTTLGPHEYAINPPGVWHTADVKEETSVLFITSGIGTKHRPR